MKIHLHLKFFFSFNVKRNKNHHPIKNSVFVAAISAAYPQKGIFSDFLAVPRLRNPAARDLLAVPWPRNPAAWECALLKAFFVYGSRALPFDILRVN
jgi:hypothetical protein